MKMKFVVECDVPSGVSVEEMVDYIQTNVAACVGGLPPSEPLFHLDRESVKVAVAR